MSGIALRSTRVLFVFAMTLSVLGCEAPLDLTGVEKVSEEAVKRYDDFLSITKNGEASVAVSSAGAILVTTDNARNWTRNDLPGAPPLIEVTTCPDGAFAALDAMRKVWISMDAGNSWEGREIDTPESVTTLTCAPDNRLWVGGSFTTLLSSADKGKTWESTSFDEDAMFTDIQFVDSSYGLAVGEFGTVAVTEDGGANWNLASNIANDFYPQAALFLDRNTGYVAGLNGKILKTADGGATWDYEKTPTDAPLYGLARQGEILFALGEGGEMLRREDGRWVSVEHGKPARSYLRAALPVDSGHILIAGGSGALFRIAAQN